MEYSYILKNEETNKESINRDSSYVSAYEISRQLSMPIKDIKDDIAHLIKNVPDIKKEIKILGDDFYLSNKAMLTFFLDTPYCGRGFHYKVACILMSALPDHDFIF